MSRTLVIANRAYSSWSMRPWLLMRVFEIPFDETLIPLHQPGTAAAILAHNPAGKVPALIDGEIRVWDSLAIIEHLAEGHPEFAIWPRDPAARALARSLSAEMHSGFSPLRRALPMNMRRAPKKPKLDKETKAEVAANVARIEAAWADARGRFGRDGPFLFGAFCAADAMFAPVVNRLDVYAVQVGEVTRAYMEAIMALPAWRDWAMQAEAEGWRNEQTDAL